MFICQKIIIMYNTHMVHTDVMRVAIYPSDQVIFPGQVFPLYDEVGSYGYGDPEALSQMMLYCRQEHRPLGIVYIPDRRGYALARIGTLASLVDPIETTFRAGGYPVVVGKARFKMLQIHHDHSFLEATVELFPWRQNPTPSWSLIENVGAYLRRYTKVMSDLLPPALMPEILTPSAETLGTLSAAILQLPEVERQRLLEIHTAQELLIEVLEHLRLYVPLAERVAEMPPLIPEACERILMN
jgi:Lon protease-like protein